MKAAVDTDIYQRLIRRVTWLIGAIGLMGSIAATVLKGPRFGVGFLLGAVLSGASFWRWTKVVEALGPASKQRPAWMWWLRIAVLIGIAYVIVKYLEVTPGAVFIGLLASAAAVIVAMLFELIHGT